VTNGIFDTAVFKTNQGKKEFIKNFENTFWKCDQAHTNVITFILYKKVFAYRRPKSVILKIVV
jgi:hypothetical protein